MRASMREKRPIYLNGASSRGQAGCSVRGKGFGESDEHAPDAAFSTIGTVAGRLALALGILLVLIGALLLLDSLDIIESVGFGELWPLILVAIGAAIIYDRIRRTWRRR